MNRSLVLLTALLLAVVLTACEPAAPRPVARPTASPTPQPPITLGAILDLGNDAGPNGTQRYEAAKLAVELVNRRGGVQLANGQTRTLELAVYDDDGRPDLAEAALRRLAQDGALAVIGPSSPESAVAARRAAETAMIPLISLDGASSGESTSWRWTFALAVPPDEPLAAAFDFFTASGVDRLAWLAPRTMDASTLHRSLVRLSVASHVQVVGEEAYAPGADEQAQALTRLQASDPRVILAWPRDADEAAAIARDAGKVQGLVPVFLGPGASGPTTLSLAGDAAPVVRTVTLRLPVADDLWDHDALTPVIRDFRRELQARTGQPPTPEAAASWDAARLLVTALEHGGTTRAALRDGVETTTEYLGASGTISFNARRHDGLDRRAFVVARSDGRRWRLPP